MYVSNSKHPALYSRVNIFGHYNRTAVHVTSSSWIVTGSSAQSHGQLITLLILTMGPVSCNFSLQEAHNVDYKFIDIFGLEAGRQAGQFMIHTYAMIPAHESDRRYALTVVQEDGQWKVKYSNEEGHEYDWRFICKNGVFAIQWCGTDDIAHGGFVLYHEDERLNLTDREAGNISPKHFLHNFYSL